MAERRAGPSDLPLSRLLGSRVALSGAPARVYDVVARLTPTEAAVTALLVRVGRRRLRVPWSRVRPGGDEVRLLPATGSADVVAESGALAQGELLLRRDVLDAPGFDRVHHRRVRIGEVWLRVADDGSTVVAGVESGGGPVRRRLGLARAASRREDLLPLGEVHLASRRGHEVSLGLGSADRQPDEELAHLVTHLPTDHAGDVLRGLPEGRADAVRRRLHPRVRERLEHARRPAGVPGRRRLRRTRGWRSYRPGDGSTP